jgi:ribosomal protein S18 acetylase RimI-like enzyme
MISRARPDDLDLLATLSAEFNDVDQHVHDESRVRAALSPLLADDLLGVVYLIGKPPEGYAVVTWGYSIESGGRDALVDEIYVRSRGEGVGGAAFTEILDDLRQRGLTRVFLETERANTRVRSFYRRQGFTEDDSIWMSREI